jgi:NAD(P)-dependent dehydrogenase (short-subunit alcohol dehydrogenase family)
VSARRSPTGWPISTGSSPPTPSVGGIFLNTMPVKFVAPRDVSNAVVYLASDESRYVTGLSLTVDAGNTIR